MNKTVVIISACAAILTAVSCSNRTPSAPQSVSVTRVTGSEAWISAGETRSALVPGMTVTINDTVTTGKATRVVLLVAGESVCVLEADSTFRPERLVVKDSVAQSRLILTAGKIVSFVKKLSKESSFEIVTPTAVAGVRGTVFGVSVAKDGSSSAAVYEGTVEVRRPANDEIVMVTVSNSVFVPASAGEGTKVSPVPKNDFQEIGLLEKEVLPPGESGPDAGQSPPVPAPEIKAREKIKADPESRDRSDSGKDPSVPAAADTTISEDFSGFQPNQSFWLPVWANSPFKAGIAHGRFVVHGTNSGTSWVAAGMTSLILMKNFQEKDLGSKKWVFEADVKFKRAPSGSGWNHGFSIGYGTYGKPGCRIAGIALAQDGMSMSTMIDGKSTVSSPIPLQSDDSAYKRIRLVYDPVGKKASGYVDGRLLGTYDIDIPPLATISVVSGGARTWIYGEYDNVRFSLEK